MRSPETCKLKHRMTVILKFAKALLTEPLDSTKILDFKGHSFQNSTKPSHTNTKEIWDRWASLRIQSKCYLLLTNQPRTS